MLIDVDRKFNVPVFYLIVDQFDDDETESGIYRVEGDETDDYFSNFPSLPLTGIDSASVEFGPSEPQFIAHVNVPSQKDVEEALVRRKKMELLEKYASESLLQQSQEARTLMGYETEKPETTMET